MLKTIGTMGEIMAALHKGTDTLLDQLGSIAVMHWGMSKGLVTIESGKWTWTDKSQKEHVEHIEHLARAIGAAI